MHDMLKRRDIFLQLPLQNLLDVARRCNCLRANDVLLLDSTFRQSRMKYESLFTVRDFTQPYENDHMQIANPEAFLRSLEPSPSVWLKKQFKNTDSYYTVDDGVECLRRVEGVMTARRLLQWCICKEPAVSAQQLGLGSVVYDQSSKMKGIICGWDATCLMPEGHFLDTELQREQYYFDVLCTDGSVRYCSRWVCVSIIELTINRTAVVV